MLSVTPIVVMNLVSTAAAASAGRCTSGLVFGLLHGLKPVSSAGKRMFQDCVHVVNQCAFDTVTLWPTWFPSLSI